MNHNRCLECTKPGCTGVEDHRCPHGYPVDVACTHCNEPERRITKPIPLVYVAGPFTAPNAFEFRANIHAAEEIGRVVAEAGAYPVIPHANTRHFVGLCTEQFWYDGTIALLAACQAIALTKDWRRSKGARNEARFAYASEIPVFDFSHVDAPGVAIALRAWVAETIHKDIAAIKAKIATMTKGNT